MPYSRKGFGMTHSTFVTARDSLGSPIHDNVMIAQRAVVNGVAWEFWVNPMKVLAESEELPCLPTALKQRSWGALKQQFTRSESKD